MLLNICFIFTDRYSVQSYLFCIASKKEELSLKKFSNEIAEQNGIIQGLKNELEERKSEIEELTSQLENEMETKRGLN